MAVREFLPSLAVLLILGATTLPAAADSCLSDLVTTVGWSAEVYGSKQGLHSDETEIRLGLRNHGQQDIVMIEGTATFVDALGNAIEPFPMDLDPDVSIPANGPGSITHLAHRGASRLATIDKGLVTASVCVTAAVMKDGAIIRR